MFRSLWMTSSTVRSVSITKVIRLVLSGPSGSGKTTLGNVLLRLLPPDTGRVDHAPALRGGRLQKLYQDPAAAFASRVPLRDSFGDVLRRFDYDRFVSQHIGNCLAVYPRRTTGNADVAEGYVTRFDKHAPELPYVDAGFSMMLGGTIDLLPPARRIGVDENVDRSEPRGHLFRATRAFGGIREIGLRTRTAARSRCAAPSTRPASRTPRSPSATSRTASPCARSRYPPRTPTRISGRPTCCCSSTHRRPPRHHRGGAGQPVPRPVGAQPGGAGGPQTSVSADAAPKAGMNCDARRCGTVQSRVSPALAPWIAR